MSAYSGRRLSNSYDVELSTVSQMHDVTTFGNNQIQYLPGSISYELTITFSDLSKLNLQPHTEVFENNELIGYITETRVNPFISRDGSAFGNRHLIKAVCHKLSVEMQNALMSREVELFNAEDGLHLLRSDDIRALVRNLREQARRDGKLSPAKYL